MIMIDSGYGVDYDRSASVAASSSDQHQVEILLGVQETKPKEILDKALIELSIPLTKTGYNVLLADLRNLTLQHPRKQMIKYYSSIIQKTYTNIENTPEIDIKRILKYCGPRIIKEQSTWKTDRELEIGLTDDDCKVIRYLCGATLKWGLKNFKGIDNQWCRDQVSNSSTLPPEFEIRNRGGV